MNIPAAKLNVLHLTASLRSGGGELFILALAKQTDRTKIVPHVYMFGTFADESLLANFEDLDLPLRVFTSSRFYNPRIWQDLVRYIKQHDIDIIHTHLCDGDIVGRITGKWLGIPVISTLQNTPSNFDQCRFDRRLLVKGTARWLSPQFVAVSERIREEFIADWQVPARDIRAIYNAVDLTPYLDIPTNSASATYDAPFVITNIARQTQQKAQHVLLHAFKRVLQEEPNCQLWFVGDGELRPQLEELTSNLGIQEHVGFWGIRRDVPDILAQSHVFVLSSLWEGLPVSAVEAMAAARPVVLTDVGGNQELIGQDRYGKLIPPNDDAALSAALLALYRDQDARHMMGNAARARVIQTFDIAQIAQQYEALYIAMSRQENKLTIQPELSN